MNWQRRRRSKSCNVKKGDQACIYIKGLKEYKLQRFVSLETIKSKCYALSQSSTQPMLYVLSFEYLLFQNLTALLLLLSGCFILGFMGFYGQLIESTVYLERAEPLEFKFSTIGNNASINDITLVGLKILVQSIAICSMIL